MPAKRAVRKRAPSSTALDARVAKKGKSKEPSEESTRDESLDAGDSAEGEDDSSSFEADEDEEDSDEDESAASSDHSEPPPSGRRASRNASGSQATPRKRGRPSAGAASSSSGQRSTLPAGLEVRFKRPQARKAGATPYMDETIHPNTFLFLGDLAANNQREWLKCEILFLLLATRLS
jgi:hypothetical protein